VNNEMSTILAKQAIQETVIISRTWLKSNIGDSTESSLGMERQCRKPDIAAGKRRKLVNLRKPNRWPLTYRLCRKML
jgi:hypothetical protein